MLRTASKFIVAMMNTKVFFIAHINQTVITSPAIGINDAFSRDMSLNNLLQRVFGSIGDDFGITLLIAF